MVAGSHCVHKHLAAGLVCRTRSIGLRVPSGEGISRIFRKAKASISRQRDRAVIRHFCCRVSLVRRKIAVVGYRDSLRRLPIDRRQRHFAGHGQFSAGIAARAVSRTPVQEDLALRRCYACRWQNNSLCASCIPVGIDRCIARTITKGIRYLKLLCIACFGIELIVPMDPRIEVERHMVLHVHPAEERISCAKRDLRHLAFRDGPAHRNVKRLEDRCPINVIHRHRVGLWDPFGVEREMVGRHLLTGEDIGAALAFFVVKPAAKCIVLHIGRSGRRITGIGNRLLIFSEQFFLLAAVIHEDDLVAVAVIIEFCTVVPRSIFGALCRIAGKAGDRIAVFIRDCRATGSTSVRMVQHIVTCKTLQVVVRFRVSLTGFEELIAPQRHSANTCLECRAARRGGPDSSRPHVADVCAVLGGNANGDDLLVLDKLSEKQPSFILNREELHGIHIPLIIDIDDG